MLGSSLNYFTRNYHSASLHYVNKTMKAEKEMAARLEEFRMGKLAKNNRQFSSLKKILIPYIWSRLLPSFHYISTPFRTHWPQSAPLPYSQSGSPLSV
jgi:hypothetical protein